MLAKRKAGNEMKRKWDWGSAVMSAMMLLMGMALGFTVIADLNERGEQSLGAHLFSVTWLAMAAALALFGQLILHEGGHLVCGLATGYRFDEAAALIDRLNTGAYAVMPLYNNMLLCDRLYCALLRGEDAYKWLAEWETKPMRQFRKQMADYLTVLRTEYAAALHAGDMQTAEAFRVRFEVRASSYPYPAEVQSERELIERFAQ